MHELRSVEEAEMASLQKREDAGSGSLAGMLSSVETTLESGDMAAKSARNRMTRPLRSASDEPTAPIRATRALTKRRPRDQPALEPLGILPGD
jgi:hypothetical protein